MYYKTIEKAAIEICKIYFQRKYKNVSFRIPESGADLEVMLSNKKVIPIEVKGTKHNTIKWKNLTAGGRDSYNLLKDGIQLFRVTEVRSKEPKIYIMIYGKHFEMTREYHWQIHPPRNNIKGSSGVA